MILHALVSLLALASGAAAAASGGATTATTTTISPSSHHHPTPSGVSARRCGSAVYACTPLAEGAPAPPSTCVNLCVKGAEPPRVPLPDGACGPPCTAPAEACVLAARAAAASTGTGGGGGMGGGASAVADAAASTAPAAPPQFEAVFDAVRPGGEACPLLAV